MVFDSQFDSGCLGRLGVRFHFLCERFYRVFQFVAGQTPRPASAANQQVASQFRANFHFRLQFEWPEVVSGDAAKPGVVLFQHSCERLVPHFFHLLALVAVNAWPDIDDIRSGLGRFR